MKLSVSITTYNHEAYIAQALDGVLAQEADFDFEIVVGDDCSTDGTRAILRAYAARYPDRILLVLPDQNQGEGGKRVFASTLEHCRGRYIAFMDGDDYWTCPTKLATQVKLMEANPDVAMCFHNVLIVSELDEGVAVPYNHWNEDREIGLESVLHGCVVASCSPVFRRDVLIPLPAWYFSLLYGDWPLFLLAAQRGRVEYLARTMGVYRLHPAGMWSRKRGTAEEVLDIPDFYGSMVTCLGLGKHPTARERLSTYLYRAAKVSAKASDWSTARRLALRSLMTRPVQPLPQTLSLSVMAVVPRVYAALATQRASLSS
ncbi:MAG: glycosyltransferase [Gemmatimonadales bacterium]|nr:MAG: glycosyltransferase [Gemmatimonadales bacterium]